MGKMQERLLKTAQLSFLIFKYMENCLARIRLGDAATDS